MQNPGLHLHRQANHEVQLQSLWLHLPLSCFKSSYLLFTDDSPLLSVGELRQPGLLAVYLSIRAGVHACVCACEATGRQIAGHF